MWAESTSKSRDRALDVILGAFGDQDITEIKPADILDVIKPPPPTMGRIYHQLIASIFDHAVLHLQCTANPAQGLAKAVVLPAVRHHPILELTQIPEFWERLNGYSGVRAALMIELLWLTTCRTAELRSAKFEEFTPEFWTVPASRMKMRRDHRIPLVPRALEIVAQLHTIRFGGDFLWGRRPMGESSFRKAFVLLGYKDFSPHGIRGSFSTWAYDQGYDSLVIEAQLGHTDSNRVRASYNRSAFIDQRRELLNSWCSAIGRHPIS